MIKHIVFWKVKDFAEGRDKQENAKLMKERIEKLKDSIPVILHIEAGISINHSDAAYDVALYSEFKDEASLEIYQKHPAHLELAAFNGKVAETRAVVDYIV
jgi:hypothetical protein